MKIYYFTREELVSFGNYLLSDERKTLKESHPELSDDAKKESLDQVSHSDVENWFGKQPIELAE